MNPERLKMDISFTNSAWETAQVRMKDKTLDELNAEFLDAQKAYEQSYVLMWFSVFLTVISGVVMVAGWGNNWLILTFGLVMVNIFLSQSTNSNARYYAYIFAIYNMRLTAHKKP